MDDPVEFSSMELNFELIPYNKPDGSYPVDDFLNSLPKKIRAKTYRSLLLLAEHGNDPQGELTKPLDDGIFEVRTKHSSDITRVLYFFMVGKKIILTNGFLKKTQKTPQKEIELARKYRDEYLNREEKQ